MHACTLAFLRWQVRRGRLYHPASVWAEHQAGVGCAQDCNGHGTHVAGCVAGLTYGVAKNATLLAVRALECLGNGTVSQARALAAVPALSCRAGGAGASCSPLTEGPCSMRARMHVCGSAMNKSPS